jgi:hypothetical protein
MSWIDSCPEATVTKGFMVFLSPFRNMLGYAIKRATAASCNFVLHIIRREDYELRVFENRVLRNTFGPKRDEVTGEWRKLHNEELHVLYFSPDIFWVIKSRRTRWVGCVAYMGERRGAYWVLVGRPEGKRLLGRPSHRLENNIKMDFKLWTGLTWLRIGTSVCSCECGNEPWVL